MSGGKRFKTVVEAEDKATGIIGKVGKAISDLTKPAANAEAGMKRVADSSAMEGISKRFDAIGNSAKSALGAIAGFTTVGGAAYAFNSMMGEMADLGRSSMAIGINVEMLQELEGAYRRVGGTADGMREKVKSLATEMRKATVGENDTALMLANQYGISLKRMKDGTFDVKSALLQISDVYKTILEKNGPQSAEAFANAFGLSNLDPLLRRGSASVRQLMDDTRATGVIMKGEATDAAIAYQKALTELEDSAWGVANAIGNALKPAITDAASKLSTGMNMARDNPRLFAYGMLQPIDDWAQRQADSLNSLFGHDPDEVKRRYGRQGLTEMFFGGGKNGRPTFDAGSTNPSAQIPFDQLTTEDFLAAAKRRPIETEHSGSVHVEIEMKNAQPGTSASVRSQGNVTATARVESSMPAYGP